MYIPLFIVIYQSLAQRIVPHRHAQYAYTSVYLDDDFHEQTVLKEYGAMQMESEVRVRELERALEDRADKLRVYERMEGELDQLVLDAAAIDDPTLAERILANYGTTAGTCTFYYIYLCMYTGVLYIFWLHSIPMAFYIINSRSKVWLHF